MNAQTVKEILIEYLKAGGFDGLACAEFECGCFLDDLIPCGDFCGDCRPGRKELWREEEVCVEAHTPDKVTSDGGSP